MLYPDGLTGVRVGPTSDITRRKYAGRARLEVAVHHDPAIQFDAGGFGEIQIRLHADAYHDEVGGNPFAALQNDAPTTDLARFPLEMEHHAMLFVYSPNETTKLRTEHTSKRMRVGGHDVDLETPSTERGGHLEADEARPKHHGTLRSIGSRNDGTAVRQRAEVVHWYAVLDDVRR